MQGLVRRRPVQRDAALGQVIEDLDRGGVRAQGQRAGQGREQDPLRRGGLGPGYTKCASPVLMISSSAVFTSATVR